MCVENTASNEGPFKKIYIAPKVEPQEWCRSPRY